MRVNARLRTYRSRILEQTQVTKEATGDIIDPALEFSSADVARNFWQASQVLSGDILHLADDDSRQTTYRAFVFSRQAVVLSVEPGQQRSFSTATYLSSILKLREPDQRFLDDVNGYLRDNSQVENFLHYYNQNVCAGRTRRALARVAGGMVFMLVDRAEAEAFLNSDGPTSKEV